MLYRVAVTKSAESNSAASTKVQVTASTKTPEGVTGRRRGSKDEEESYSFEPTAICNYACFICKYRKDPKRALAMFTEAIER